MIDKIKEVNNSRPDPRRHPRRNPRRVGIFAGTFDPVHKGHLAFALQAIETAGLDEVVFLPELQHRKAGISHLSHRIVMLKLVTAGHAKLKVLQLPDKRFTVPHTLPRLRRAYPDDVLFMLIGTDVLEHISVWPMAKQLLATTGLVVAVRGAKDEQHAHKLIGVLPAQPLETHVLVSHYKAVSSRHIRDAFRAGKPPDGELGSIKKYITEHWLYQPDPREAIRRQRLKP